MSRCPAHILALLVAALAVGCGDEKTDPQLFRERLEKLAARETDVIDCRGMPKVGDVEMRLLASSPEIDSLHELILDDSQVTDAGIRHLPVMPHLSFFSASKTRVTDESLPLFARGGNLESLRLDGTSVTDVGLQSVGEMKALRSLSLWRCPVTDEGLAHLKSLKKLQSLSLDETSVTGPGLLRHVAPLSTLRSLSVWQTKVSAAEAGELRKLLPSLKVNQ